MPYCAYKERDRGIADYADCIDDDYSIIDSDDSVCDDWRDGLTKEEEELYNRECKELKELRRTLIDAMGYEGFQDWKKTVMVVIK